MDGVYLAVGDRNLRIAVKKKLSPALADTICGCRNIGSFINTPKTSNRKILAGFFCLNMPITDNGTILKNANYNQLLQSKYSYDKHRE